MSISLFLIVFMAAHGQDLSYPQTEDIDIQKVIYDLRAEKSVYRFRSLENLKKIQIEPLKKAEILLEGLKYEVEHPLDDNFHPYHNFYTGSEATKLEYVSQLSKLGKSILAILYKWYEKSNGELRDQITFSILVCGDDSYENKLWDIFYNSKNNFTKAKALRSILNRKLFDKRHIPLFKELLSDSFCVRSGSCVVGGGELEYMNYECPIRDISYSALIELGIKVKRNKLEYYIVEEGK